MAAIRWAHMMLNEFGYFWSLIYSTVFTLSWKTWSPSWNPEYTILFQPSEEPLAFETSSITSVFNHRSVIPFRKLCWLKKWYSNRSMLFTGRPSSAEYDLSIVKNFNHMYLWVTFSQALMATMVISVSTNSKNSFWLISIKIMMVKEVIEKIHTDHNRNKRQVWKSRASALQWSGGLKGLVWKAWRTTFPIEMLLH